jgi:two-component system chemotaxis response regulator CheY
MKFLIVDDSSTIRRIIKNTLTRLGYNNFVEAADGIEAW